MSQVVKEFGQKNQNKSNFIINGYEFRNNEKDIFRLFINQNMITATIYKKSNNGIIIRDIKNNDLYEISNDKNVLPVFIIKTNFKTIYKPFNPIEKVVSSLIIINELY